MLCCVGTRRAAAADTLQPAVEPKHHAKAHPIAQTRSIRALTLQPHAPELAEPSSTPARPACVRASIAIPCAGAVLRLAAAGASAADD